MKRTFWILAALSVIATYPLSYAPVVRWRGGNFPMMINDMTFYRPVEWLIDTTPAQAPLMWWASVWGVDLTIASNSLLRRNPNPAYYAIPVGSYEATQLSSPDSCERRVAAEWELPPTQAE